MPPKKEPPVASKRVELTDPHNSPPTFADWIVTGGSHEGVLNITLGAVDYSLRQKEDDATIVAIVSQLRLPVPVAVRLHAFLGRILMNETKNERPIPTTPPKNQIN